MGVSNRTLSIFLLIAVVINISGAFFVLSKIDELSSTAYMTHGNVGVVSANVVDNLIITTADSNEINFGQCTLKEDSSGITINSENLGDTLVHCEEFNESTPISVRNMGNVPVNVQISVSKVGSDEGGTFLNKSLETSNSSLRYKFINEGIDSFEGGCQGILGPGPGSNTMEEYFVFNTTNEINACDYLSSHGVYNSFLTHFEIVVPDYAYDSDDVQVTFIATQVS